MNIDFSTILGAAGIAAGGPFGGILGNAVGGAAKQFMHRNDGSDKPDSRQPASGGWGGDPQKPSSAPDKKCNFIPYCVPEDGCKKRRGIDDHVDHANLECMQLTYGKGKTKPYPNHDACVALYLDQVNDHCDEDCTLKQPSCAGAEACIKRDDGKCVYINALH